MPPAEGAAGDRDQDERRISVLSLQTDDGLGGTELMAYQILSRLDPRRFRVTVCYLSPPGPVTELYRCRGIEVRHLRGDASTARWPVRLWHVLRSTQSDILEVYGLRLNVVGRLMGRASGHGTIVTMQRSTDDWRRWWHVWLDRLTSPLVTLYVANSRAGGERLAARERIRRSRIGVITNGIDPAPYERADRGRVREACSLAADAVVLVCVANFRPAKAHHVLVEAYARLAEVDQRVHLWLVGEDADDAAGRPAPAPAAAPPATRAALEAMVAARGLSARVTFLGPRSDIPQVLADSDVFVLPSRWEGMPGSILEAMAARLPVVASRVGGIPEVVVDGETGYLVSPGCPDELAASLLRLTRDQRLRREMGDRALDRVRREYAIEAKVAAFERLYARLGSGRATRRSRHAARGPS